MAEKMKDLGNGKMIITGAPTPMKSGNNNPMLKKTGNMKNESMGKTAGSKMAPMPDPKQQQSQKTPKTDGINSLKEKSPALTAVDMRYVNSAKQLWGYTKPTTREGAE